LQKYTGESDPAGHVEQCGTLWNLVPETGMDTHIYTYTRYNSKELVFGIGNA
jgi:hypothetical protein